jgi:hypothetical protein
MSAAVPHGVGGSNPIFQQNRKFAEFFAVYRKNCVFWPHPFKSRWQLHKITENNTKKLICIIFDKKLDIFSQKHLVTLPAEYTPVTIDQTSFWGRAKAESFLHFSLLKKSYYSTSRCIISMVSCAGILSVPTSSWFA